MNFCRLVLVLIFLLSLSQAATTGKTRVMTGSAAKSGVPANLRVVPDIAERAARFKRVQMPFRTAGLSARELQMIRKLVEACQYIESIYWRQSDPDALTLYQSLESSTNARDNHLRRYLWINASRFDMFHDNKPFAGTGTMPLGHGFYPGNLSRAQVEQYVQKNPDQKASIYNQYSIVRWLGNQLETVPYHVAYRTFLEPAARALRAAASVSDDPSFANFLRLRADALLSDNYLESDLAWLKLKNPKVDIIFGPYETYMDDLLGVKGSYGAGIMVRNDRESKKLDLFSKYLPDIQDALPLPAEDRPSKHGLEAPMEVVDSPFRSGDLTHGYQAVADNLPNDPRVHEQAGSKRIFFRNFMDARVNYVMVPLARKIMEPGQAGKVTGDGYMVGTVLHEVCHGLGPAFARTRAGKIDIREAIGPQYSSLEEAKADATGMFAVQWLIDHAVLPKRNLEEYYASYVADLFRSARFGAAEAHGQAEIMELNYLLERSAMQRNGQGRYAIDYAKMPAALAELSKELLEIEATGDRPRAEKWFARYGTMSEDLQRSLKTASDVPIDIDPVFSFASKIK
ncbi:MAG TPA: hypothetical protein VMI10_13725 [Terriglobales bacterium]|nr:hypothetical protein [Terriglobales bacterium]